MKTEWREIRLPVELCTAAEERFRHQFSNLEHLLEFVLGELLCEDGIKLGQAEQQAIEERLRDLGYI
jgi:hypothetical protein